MTAPLVIIDRYLPDTRSRFLRFYDFVHLGGEQVEYVLNTRQWTRNYKKLERCTYAVQEVDPRTHHEDGRVFLLTLVTGNSETLTAEVYECYVPRDARRLGRCSCFGHNTAERCKHLAALTDACRAQNSESSPDQPDPDDIEAILLGEHHRA